MTDVRPKVDGDRFGRELLELATFSDTDPPAVTRLLYSTADMRAREFLKWVSAEAGLIVRDDPIGNIFARWPGSEPAIAAVGTGSHTDAIPHSGRYDGTVGVLGGLAAIRALQAAGFRPRRSIELLMFTSEEPTRFGIGCVGSRALAGMLTPEVLADLRDPDGQPLDDVRQSIGLRGDLADVRLSPDYYSAFVELHIEQGPILEREDVPIGVVTAIAAPAALRVMLEGAGGHAGAVLMPDRRDALCAAAEIVLAVEAATKATGSADTVATTGVCRVHPGAINSVPSRVDLEIDVRDVRLGPRDQAVAAIRSSVDHVCRRRGVRATVDLLNADPPATMAEGVIAAAQAACQRLELPYRRMVSRAYHDSLFMARICDTGMIFIPCLGDVSHRPDEYAPPEAITHGVEVLALTLAQLSVRV
jgi:N-carbamoyl-L-amino-acid hydrolase